MKIGDVAKKALAARKTLGDADKSALKSAAKSGDKQMIGRKARVTAGNIPDIEADDVEPTRKKLAKDYYKQVDESSFDALEKRAQGKIDGKAKGLAIEQLGEEKAQTLSRTGKVPSTSQRIDNHFNNRKIELQGKALAKAESTAPAYKNTVSPTKKAATLNKSSMADGISDANPFGQLERDLPKGGKAMRVAAEEGVANVEKKAAKSGLKRMVGAGLLGGAVGLGVNALMEGLDAEETGSEEEDLDVVSKRQGEKTSAMLKANKLKNSVKASTKKRVAPSLPDNVKKTTVVTPKPRSDASITKGFNEQLDKNFGKEEDQPGTSYKSKPVDIEGMENVEKVMRDEFKGAASRSNKKPISKYMKR